MHGLRFSLLLSCGLTFAACAPMKPAPDAHVPPFARKPYEPLSRDTVVQVALREWRLFGQFVDDDPPGARPPSDIKPERDPGLWQRIGEYWWLGLDATRPEAAWTGKHDEAGRVFPPAEDGKFAWSAAFVSYVMRIAGAGPRFPYSPGHWEYIDAAKRAADGNANNAAVVAERPEAYAPQLGDLICAGRGNASTLRFEQLPAGPFPAHCEIVVAVAAGQISTIGGNAADTVAMKHVPVTPDGRLATPEGQVLDSRYPWMVVLRLTVPTLSS